MSYAINICFMIETSCLHGELPALAGLRAQQLHVASVSGEFLIQQVIESDAPPNHPNLPVVAHLQQKEMLHNTDTSKVL